VTEQTETPSADLSAGAEPAATSPLGGVSVSSIATDRPEVVVGGAFAGGLLLAMILKRLAR
jgi:hypothetical protein